MAVKLLRRSQELQRCLTEVAVSCGDLTNIAQTLADLLGNTVIITDGKFSLLSFALLEKAPQKNKRKAYVGSALYQQLYNLEKTGFISKIIEKKKTQRVEVLFSKQGKQSWVVVPVLISGDCLGYIAVSEDYHKLQEADCRALEQASSIIAVAIYKKIAEEEVLCRQRNDFLLNILQKKVVMDANAVERARHLGMFFGQAMFLFQIAFINLEEYCATQFANGQEERDIIQKKLLGLIADQLAARCNEMRIAYDNEQITIVCSTDNGDLHKQALIRIQRIKQEIQRLAPGLICAVGVGRLCENYQSLPRSYQEAQEALAIGRKLEVNDDVHFFSNLGLYQFLVKFKGMKELKNYYHSIFGKMDKVDIATRYEFLKTLEAYFSANTNIYKAAQHLYLHRNSMQYRLKRIEKILEIDLNEPDMRFNVQLALKIRHLL